MSVWYVYACMQISIYPCNKTSWSDKSLIQICWILNSHVSSSSCTPNRQNHPPILDCSDKCCALSGTRICMKTALPLSHLNISQTKKQVTTYNVLAGRSQESIWCHLLQVEGYSHPTRGRNSCTLWPSSQHITLEERGILVLDKFS
jgi:hypothetical protein